LAIILVLIFVIFGVNRCSFSDPFSNIPTPSNSSVPPGV
jgi:hypothetical protein